MRTARHLVPLASLLASAILAAGCEVAPVVAAEEVAACDGKCDDGELDLGGCLTQHLREAIRLNLERRPRYEELTAGRSREVSDSLIGHERLAIVGALVIDLRASYWHHYGVNIVCDELVSMANVPPFTPSTSTTPLEDYEPLDVRALRRTLDDALGDRDFASLGLAVEDALESLAGQPRFHCMVRHLLESLLRIANLAPIQAQRAADQDLWSTEGLSASLIGSHLMLLDTAGKLDTLAAPLQAQGVPIVCQDVPPIPPGP